MTLETLRLRLVPWDPQQLLALIDAPEGFEEVVGYPAAEGLQGFYKSGDVSPAWLATLRTSVGPDPWRHGFFVLQREHKCVIGGAGFKGPPDADGMVEIAYGIAPEYQGQGYATEAATALLDYAFGSGRVRLARAHTLPEANASTHVLKKCGFEFTGSVVDPEDGTVWRWERGL
jgi:RimJ/RimL family protein N-acetyltransferase